MNKRIIAIVSMASILAGCSHSGVKNNVTTTITAPDGTVTVIEDKTKTGGDIAALQLSLEIQEAKANTLASVAKLDKEAQNTMMIRGDLWTDEYSAYIRGEVAEGEQIRSGVTAGVWGLVGLGAVYGLNKTIQKGYENAGSTTNTGPISISKSDDPIGGGEGGSTGSIGGQGVVIGGGSAITDQGQWANQIDKNMDTAFKDSSSNLDGSGDPSGVVLQDQDDIKNDVGIIP